MSHYAYVINNKVITVNKFGDEENLKIETPSFLPPNGIWLQTSYNTKGGVHYDSNGKPDGGVAIRYNYASTGYAYDSQADAFYEPNPPYPSWTLDKLTYLWVAPVPIPNDTVVAGWDETEQSWITISSPYPSWILVNNQWLPPKPSPGVGWSWDEESVSWIPDNPLVKANNV